MGGGRENFGGRRESFSGPPGKRSDTPRKYPVSEQLKHFNCPEGECLGFFRHGKCPRQNKGKPCSFKHTPNTQGRGLSREGGRSSSKSPVPQARSLTPSPRTQVGGVGSGVTCGKCGNVHKGVCLFTNGVTVMGGITPQRCEKQYTTVTFGSGDRNRRNSV